MNRPNDLVNELVWSWLRAESWSKIWLTEVELFMLYELANQVVVAKSKILGEVAAGWDANGAEV